MKYLVCLALAAGALAVTGCDDVAPPKPAAPLAAAPAAPAPTPATPAAEYSCGDGYIFDSDQVPGPEGAVVNDVFYWGSSTSGAARCFSDTRNNSMVGRVESNAGNAIAATTMSVTLSGERRKRRIGVWPTVAQDRVDHAQPHLLRPPAPIPGPSRSSGFSSQSAGGRQRLAVRGST